MLSPCAIEDAALAVADVGFYQRRRRRVRAPRLILYRLLAVVQDADGRVVALAALFILLLYNELWNCAFIGQRSSYAGWVGVVAFLAPLAVLQVALAVDDRPSALIFDRSCGKKRLMPVSVGNRMNCSIFDKSERLCRAIF